MKRRMMLVSGMLLFAALALSIACSSDDDKESSEGAKTPTAATQVAQQTAQTGTQSPGDSTPSQSGQTPGGGQAQITPNAVGESTQEAASDATRSAEHDSQDATEASQDATEQAGEQTADANHGTPVR